MDQYQKCVTGIFLAVCSYTDMKGRIIYRKVLVSYLMLVLLGRCIQGGSGLVNLVTGFLPGLLCLLFSWITREGLGYGDSLLIFVCGGALGWRLCTEITVCAFFLAGIWGMACLCRNRRCGKDSFPFVPFLLAGFLIQLAVKTG